MEIFILAVSYLVVCLVWGPPAWRVAGQLSWIAARWKMPSKMGRDNECLVRDAEKLQILYWLLAPLSLVIAAGMLAVIIIRAFAVIGLLIAGEHKD